METVLHVGSMVVDGMAWTIGIVVIVGIIAAVNAYFDSRSGDKPSKTEEYHRRCLIELQVRNEITLDMKFLSAKRNELLDRIAKALEEANEIIEKQAEPWNEDDRVSIPLQEHRVDGTGGVATNVTPIQGL